MNREELIKRIDGRMVIASVSGGKDSAAMCLHLMELEIPFRAVFMDTGWEHDLTYKYLRETLPPVIGEITWLQAPLQMEELIRKKGMFPSRARKFCTTELKVKPMQAYLPKASAGRKWWSGSGPRRLTARCGDRSSTGLKRT
jgi:3'-phosphoadenosine 5'-phosphosulfate sulfotransferase (PAPS reductase)/FAD synthetase